MKPDKPATRRLFFALWPGGQTRDEMASLARELKKQGGGHLVKTENLHLTLAFLGNVSSEQQQCMQQAVAGIPLAGFSLRLSQTGYWPRPRVSWLGCRQMPPELLQLVEQLNSRLAGCGYQPETRPFQAHVTLLRKAKHAPATVQVDDIHWKVDGFVLVESITHPEGVEYRVIDQWPLR